MCFMCIYILVDCVPDQWEGLKRLVGVCVEVWVCVWGVCMCNGSMWVDVFEWFIEFGGYGCEWNYVSHKQVLLIICFAIFLFVLDCKIVVIADVANSKRHQRLDEKLFVYKKTISEMCAFITSLCCMKHTHYSKRMLRKQVCVKFRGRIAWQSFLKTTLLISPM